MHHRLIRVLSASYKYTPQCKNNLVTKIPRGRRSNIKVLTGFGKRLKSISKKSDDSLIKDSEQSVVEFFQSLRLLPKEHLWRIEGAAVFDEVTRESEGVEEVNKRYWASVCNDIEAILIQTNFRGEELIQPIPRMLESGNINASATICRSLLELSSNFLDIARTIDETTAGLVRHVSDEKVDLTQTFVGSSEIVDDLLVKASFRNKV